MARNRRYYEIKQALRAIHGDACPGCARIMRFGGAGKAPYATLDHVIPKARGGTDDPGNFQLLCNYCNIAKVNRLETRVYGGQDGCV